MLTASNKTGTIIYYFSSNEPKTLGANPTFGTGETPDLFKNVTGGAAPSTVFQPVFGFGSGASTNFPAKKAEPSKTLFAEPTAKKSGPGNIFGKPVDREARMPENIFGAKTPAGEKKPTFGDSSSLFGTRFQASGMVAPPKDIFGRSSPAPLFSQSTKCQWLKTLFSKLTPLKK